MEALGDLFVGEGTVAVLVESREGLAGGEALLLGAVVALLVEERGDGTDAGAHTGGDDEADAGTGLDVAGGEGHVVGGELLRLAGDAGLDLGVLSHILGLSGEKHLVDAEVVGLDAAAVGRDDVTGAELDDITAHHVLGLDGNLLAVANDGAHGRLEGGESLEGVVGAVLGDRRDGGVDQDDDGDGDRVDVGEELVLVVAGGLDRGGRHDRGHEQVHDHGIELNEEQDEEGDARGLLELVRAVLLEPLRRLGGGEAGLTVRL
mmetsp:Transcript_13347/g.52259  ORF Transcript_13347/g.52259 Transcript_13347/m.52259 type:complete len:262 (+) Transcript_13347:2857-3642(+)